MKTGSIFLGSFLLLTLLSAQTNLNNLELDLNSLTAQTTNIRQSTTSGTPSTGTGVNYTLGGSTGSNTTGTSIIGNSISGNTIISGTRSLINTLTNTIISPTTNTSGTGTRYTTTGTTGGISTGSTRVTPSTGTGVNYTLGGSTGSNTTGTTNLIQTTNTGTRTTNSVQTSNSQNPANNYPVSNCTVPTAENYNPNALIDDGSCIACKDPQNPKYVGNQYVGRIQEKNNYCIKENPYNPGSLCTVNAFHPDYEELCPNECKNPKALNYSNDPTKEHNSLKCKFHGGCMDEYSTNYDADAIWDDGTCNYNPLTYGCLDSADPNYDRDATINDPSMCAGVTPPSNPPTTNPGTEQCFPASAPIGGSQSCPDGSAVSVSFFNGSAYYYCPAYCIGSGNNPENPRPQNPPADRPPRPGDICCAPKADNYAGSTSCSEPLAGKPNMSTCKFTGCMNSSALNYDRNANVSGSCQDATPPSNPPNNNPPPTPPGRPNIQNQPVQRPANNQPTDPNNDKSIWDHMKEAYEKLKESFDKDPVNNTPPENTPTEPAPEYDDTTPTITSDDLPGNQVPRPPVSIDAPLYEKEIGAPNTRPTNPNANPADDRDRDRDRVLPPPTPGFQNPNNNTPPPFFPPVVNNPIPSVFQNTPIGNIQNVASTFRDSVQKFLEKIAATNPTSGLPEGFVSPVDETLPPIANFENIIDFTNEVTSGPQGTDRDRAGDSSVMSGVIGQLLGMNDAGSSENTVTINPPQGNNPPSTGDTVSGVEEKITIEKNIPISEFSFNTDKNNSGSNLSNTHNSNTSSGIPNDGPILSMTIPIDSQKEAIKKDENGEPVANLNQAAIVTVQTPEGEKKVLVVANDVGGVHIDGNQYDRGFGEFGINFFDHLIDQGVDIKIGKNSLTIPEGIDMTISLLEDTQIKTVEEYNNLKDKLEKQGLLSPNISSDVYAEDDTLKELQNESIALNDNPLSEGLELARDALLALVSPSENGTTPGDKSQTTTTGNTLDKSPGLVGGILVGFTTPPSQPEQVSQIELPETELEIPDLGDEVLKKGSEGEEVRELQKFLEKEGYLEEGNVTGTFGPLTEKAVEKFQQDKELNDDGIVGDLTKEAIYSESTGTSATNDSETVPQTEVDEEVVEDSVGTLLPSNGSELEADLFPNENDPQQGDADWYADGAAPEGSLKEKGTTGNPLPENTEVVSGVIGEAVDKLVDFITNPSGTVVSSPSDDEKLSHIIGDEGEIPGPNYNEMLTEIMKDNASDNTVTELTPNTNQDNYTRDTGLDRGPIILPGQNNPENVVQVTVEEPIVKPVGGLVERGLQNVVADISGEQKSETVGGLVGQAIEKAVEITTGEVTEPAVERAPFDPLLPDVPDEDLFRLQDERDVPVFDPNIETGPVEKPDQFKQTQNNDGHSANTIGSQAISDRLSEEEAANQTESLGASNTFENPNFSLPYFYERSQQVSQTQAANESVLLDDYISQLTQEGVNPSTLSDFKAELIKNTDPNISMSEIAEKFNLPNTEMLDLVPGAFATDINTNTDYSEVGSTYKDNLNPTNPPIDFGVLSNITIPKTFEDASGTLLNNNFFPENISYTIEDPQTSSPTQSNPVPFNELSPEDQQNPSIQNIYKELDLFPDAEYEIEGYSQSNNNTPTLPSGTFNLSEYLKLMGIQR
jgi:peptidoglycan hydrolase-like protein with peptidoglycan-binding domain